MAKYEERFNDTSKTLAKTILSSKKIGFNSSVVFIKISGGWVVKVGHKEHERVRTI